LLIILSQLILTVADYFVVVNINCCLFLVARLSDSDGDGGIYQGISAHGREMLQWKTVHRLFKSVDLPTKWINGPDPVWGSRYRNEAHVLVLKESFIDTATVNEHVYVILEDAQMYEAMLQWRGAGADESKMGELAVENLVKRVGRGLQAFAGDHSRYATQKLQLQFPNCELWRTIPKCELFIAPPTPENRRMLRILSNLDNITQGLQLKLNFWVVVEQHHRHLLSLTDDYADGMVPHGAAKQLRLDLVKTKLVDSIATSKQIHALCMHQGQVWDLIAEILQGNVAPVPGKKKAPAPPKSCYPFNCMGGIPATTVVTSLQKVIAGEWTVATLRKQCVLYKAKRRVRGEVVQILLQKTDLASKCEDENPTWDEVRKFYPSVTDPAFLGPWFTFVATLKLADPMPGTFIAAMNELITFANQIQVRIFMFSVVFCHHLTTCARFALTEGQRGGKGVQVLPVQRLHGRGLRHERLRSGQESDGAKLP
jgi:hypothetical protein